MCACVCVSVSENAVYPQTAILAPNFRHIYLLHPMSWAWGWLGSGDTTDPTF